MNHDLWFSSPVVQLEASKLRFSLFASIDSRLRKVVQVYRNAINDAEVHVITTLLTPELASLSRRTTFRR